MKRTFNKDNAGFYFEIETDPKLGRVYNLSYYRNRKSGLKFSYTNGDFYLLLGKLLIFRETIPFQILAHESRLVLAYRYNSHYIHLRL